MNSTQVTSSFVAILIILGIVQSLPAQTKKTKPLCPDEKTYTGKYRNRAYGFSLVIPRGLQGYWNSSACEPDEKYGCICMTDHGRYIPLANDAVIEAFAGYQMEPDWSASDQEKSKIALLRDNNAYEQVEVISSNQFQRGRLQGRRLVVSYVSNGKRLMQDQIFAARQGVEYELMLNTTTERFQADEAQFEKVIASWKLTSRR